MLHFVEWPGIMAYGDTREEAVRQIQLQTTGACARARRMTGFCPI
jgi:hypothetical protein